MILWDPFSTSVVFFGAGCMILGGERLVLLRRKSPWALLNAGFAVENGQFGNHEKYLLIKTRIQMAKSLSGASCLIVALLAPAWVVLPLVAAAAALIFDRTIEYVGGDGADQQLRIVGVVLALASLALPVDANAKAACMGFLACELALCYWMAGWCKLRNPEWRRGEAVHCIAAASVYGEGHFSPLFARVPWLTKGLSWGVIGFEITFPLFLFSGSWAVAGLALAFAFHLAVAIGMKLNSFLWVFPISFPAFYTTAEWISSR